MDSKFLAWRIWERDQQEGPNSQCAVHPYISGQPHRIKYLEAIYDYIGRFDGVLHWNGLEILDWYCAAAAL